LWPCGRKVTSLPRDASIYMVVAMRADDVAGGAGEA